MGMPNNNQLALLELLKESLFEIEPVFLTDIDWEAVLVEAKAQTVVALAVKAVPAEYADKAVEIIRSSRYGEKATVIGQVLETENPKGELYLKTAIGGLRALDVLQGEGLPRIC